MLRPLPNIVFLGSPFSLQLRQQLLDAVFLLERGEAVFHVVAGDFGFRLTEGLGVSHLALHAVEGCGFRAVADGQARVAGLADGAGAAMLRDQHVGLGLRFG